MEGKTETKIQEPAELRLLFTITHRLAVFRIECIIVDNRVITAAKIKWIMVV